MGIGVRAEMGTAAYDIAEVDKGISLPLMKAKLARSLLSVREKFQDELGQAEGQAIQRVRSSDNSLKEN